MNESPDPTRSFDRTESIFAAALELPSGTERAAYLVTACAGDAALQARIEALLRAHDRAGHLLDRPAPIGPAPVGPGPGGYDPTLTLPTAVQPGTIIAGRYKLLEAIGEGGMGSVWVAEQSQPVKRKVALKLIKAGMDSKSVLARFEAERQALAVMDHPNIAKVLDGGLTDQGRPYFVMEYVKGIPITEFCDSRQLSVPERLQLFAQVCQAVQHAHQKGIIHRDLKPSNILVAPYDDKAVPKVIDFGLAKAMHQSLTENTLHTAHDMVLGTPLYMSPEQAQLNNIDIDTRSDIYSLGVLLYELLTGSTPLEKQRFKQAAWDEMRRMIREEDPPVPSQRLSSAETLPSVAAGRHTEPKRLTRLVRGELDWIVMKALEKDRARRYETANGFAADVVRYLSGEPVTAAPPSRMYRVQKFVRRNQSKVIAASLVLLTLLAGMAGTSWQWYRAEHLLAEEAIQRQRAEDNQRAAESARADAVAQQARAQEQEAEAIKQAAAAKAQEAEARKQAEIAEAVAKFQTDMLAAVDPNQLPKDPVTKEPMRDAVTVVQALEAAVKLLDAGNLKNQPLVEANVRSTIGNTLRELARYDDAEPNLRRSLELLRASLPSGHPRIALGLNRVALLLMAQNKLAQAEPLLRESLANYRASRPAGHPDIAQGLNNLATLLQSQNRLAEAEPLLRESLANYRAAHPAGHPDIAIGLNNLAMLLQDQNKLAEAEPLMREALKIDREAFPVGHPRIATSLNNLAEMLRVQNKLVEAETLYREALEIRREAFRAGHPHIAESLNNLANLRHAQNKLAEAEPLYREALEIWRATLPVGHPNIATSLNNLAQLLFVQNKLAEAEPLFREALEIRRETLPSGHPSIATSLNNLAGLLKNQNRLADAEPLSREALEIWRAALPVGHPNIALGLNNLADVLRGQNKLAEAEPFYREVLEIDRAALPAGHPDIAISLGNLASLLLNQSRPSEAEPLIREALTIREKSQPDAWTTFNTKSMLGGALLGQKKFAEAESLLMTGYEGLHQRETTIPARSKVYIPEALERLVQLYADWHAAEPDQGYDAKAAEWKGRLEEYHSALAEDRPISTSEK